MEVLDYSDSFGGEISAKVQLGWVRVRERGKEMGIESGGLSGNLVVEGGEVKVGTGEETGPGERLQA